MWKENIWCVVWVKPPLPGYLMTMVTTNAQTCFNELRFICSVSGGELFQRVADADCLTEKEASFYMYQLLQGLQYMHMKNIVHLDLKVTKSFHIADHKKFYLSSS